MFQHNKQLLYNLQDLEKSSLFENILFKKHSQQQGLTGEHLQHPVGAFPAAAVTLDRRNVAVVIPALNEALRIREVVEGALGQCDRVIVIAYADLDARDLADFTPSLRS